MAGATAMKDLGSIPRRAVAIKNLNSGIVVLKKAVDWEAWENMIRFAANHQDEIEILYNAPEGMEEPESQVGEDQEEEKPLELGVDGGVKLTPQILRSQNFKQLVKLAKDRGIKDPGNTKELVVEAIMATVE